MIRNTVVNTTNYFYPLGNTPPVSLTQDLPPEQDADILLLGCGDVRNILFTCFADPARKLDITCCDIEPAILARNVLLYSLLIDDVDQTGIEQVWNIYYHWMLDGESFKLLYTQVEKLLSISESFTKWRKSAYGTCIRFCNQSTLTKVRDFWQLCVHTGSSESSESEKRESLAANLKSAKAIRQAQLGDHISLTAMRSAAPTGIYALSDFSAVVKKWWLDGTTTFDKVHTSAATQLNPAFLATSNQSLRLHYGTDPLLGFPLATAYVPLLEGTTLQVKRKGESSESYLVRCARQHFRSWTKACLTSFSVGTVLRFCNADALSFALSLCNAIPQPNGDLGANLPEHNWTAEPLVLDAVEYTTGLPGLAPRTFDIIDTSNLLDHLGPLNLLPASAAVLKNVTCSTIYTEALVQSDSTEKERIASVLGGDIRTVALMLGLSPCEVWTNATNSPEDDSMFDLASGSSRQFRKSGSTQTRSRFRWKKMHRPDINVAGPSLVMAPVDIARVLIDLYNHMFQHENLRTMLSNLKMVASGKLAHPYYNRFGFAVLIRAIQANVITDWSKCLDDIDAQIVAGYSSSPIGANFAQEFQLYLYRLGLKPSPFPIPDLTANKSSHLVPLFRQWSDIPVQVCLTLRVPRSSLRKLTAKEVLKIGTPTLRCDIEGGGGTVRPWSNIFTAIQLAFGSAQVVSDRGTPRIQITEDQAFWHGKSDMFLSTLVPTWILLQPGGNIPIVRCALLSTPHTTTALAAVLGIHLALFETQVSSDNVIVTQFMPGMDGLPQLTNVDGEKSHETLRKTTLSLAAHETMVSTMTQRLGFTSTEERVALQERSTPVQLHFTDQLRATISIGKSIKSDIHFPVPIDPGRHKLRIARKSLYVEVEAPLWNPLAELKPTFLFPIAPPRKLFSKTDLPIPWTVTRLNLDILPVIDLRDKKKLEWLVTHASVMFSTRERKIREAGIAASLPTATNPNVRIEVKEGIFTMFMSFSGLQGQKTRAYGLTAESNGINVLFFPSCIRLDLVNRTTVLDAAVFPLTSGVHSDRKVEAFYKSLSLEPIMQIKVSKDELQCWKSILPAFVERCRTWSHRPNCEYNGKEVIPDPAGLEEGFSPLCSCGHDQFPRDYLKDTKISNFDHILKRYATRVAISPIFAIPYVEDCFMAGMSLPKSPAEQPSSKPTTGCRKCGRERREDSDASQEAKLLVCSRCKKVRYCSAQCQKADWKVHKQSCSSE